MTEYEVEFFSRAFRQVKSPLDLLFQVTVIGDQPQTECFEFRRFTDGILCFLGFGFQVHHLMFLYLFAGRPALFPPDVGANHPGC